MGKFEIDVFRNVARFRCDCGRRVTVPIEEIRVGSIDYCGCGRSTITIGEGDITRYRQVAGVPETSE